MSIHTPKKISWEMQFLGGLNLRSLAILGLTIPIAGSMIFTTLIPGPIGLRIALGLIVAGLGLAMVFAKIGGRTFEEWLLDLIVWRWGSRKYIWNRGERTASSQVEFATQEVETTSCHLPTTNAAAVNPAPARTEDVAQPRYTVIGLGINMMVIIILTLLTIYLAGGADNELRAFFRSLTGRW